MLIRNARVEGYPGLTDLRLMHGAVQEIGVGLQKGLYESELDLMGDELRPCPLGMTLPRRYRRLRRDGEDIHIRPGTPEPLLRIRGSEVVGFVDCHSAD